MQILILKSLLLAVVMMVAFAVGASALDVELRWLLTEHGILAPQDDARVWFHPQGGLVRPFMVNLRAGSGKMYIRSILVNELGDSGEVGFRRAGPDGRITDYGVSPEAITPDTQLGLVYWQGLGYNCRGELEYDACSGPRRQAQVFAVALETPTESSGAGDLFLATTPYGSVMPMARLQIAQDGDVFFLSHAGASRTTPACLDENGRLIRC